MKRMLSLMLLLIVFTGCSNAQNSDRPNGDDIMGDVCITEIECVVQSGNKFSFLLT